MECSISSESICYNNDLQLAAELGKVLLERNKELEAQLLEHQQGRAEHNQQITLLTKQVEVLRHANDSRMRIYEEVDKSAQDLEKVNQDLRQTLRAERSKVKSLNQTIETLERRCDELQAKLERLRRDNKNKKERERGVRTWSVPSLDDSEFGFGYKGIPKENYDYLGFPSLSNTTNSKKIELQKKEIKDLKDTVRVLKLQYATEQKMRYDLERNVDNLKSDNQSLIQRIKELEEDLERQKEIYKQALKAAKKEKEEHSPLCAKCPSRAASVTGSDIGDGEFLEHDLDELPRKQVVRLKCGGSAYGSRESLNQIGLEAVTPTLESCSDILVDAVQRNPSTADSPEETPTREAPDPDNTLLGELEEQYRKLVKKYESLIIAKSKREQTQDTATQDKEPSETKSTSSDPSPVKLRRPKALGISREVQTAWRKSSCGLDFTSPVNPVEGSFQRGPPEYKRLFKEIFETLQKSTEFNGQTSPTEQSKR